jgi:hypothetical protein
MSGQDVISSRALHGTIRHRLLVNAVVDPDEAARHLPGGLRPHVTGEGTVVGCCLLSLEHVRPAGVPAALGARLRAAAHRISVEWDDEAGTTVGVYVPVRHTDSVAARAIGGRGFPGVHRAAAIRIDDEDDRLRWSVDPRRGDDRFAVRVEASPVPGDDTMSCDPIGSTCLAASVGLSPDRRGVLEAARMEPDRRAAQPVEVLVLDSRFLAGFASARPAPSYLMHDVDVRWTRAEAPRRAGREVAA